LADSRRVALRHVEQWTPTPTVSPPRTAITAPPETRMTSGAVAMAPFAGLARLPAEPLDWLLLATLGLVHTGVMSTLLYGAIQKIPTALVGALSFIYPAVAIVMDWAAFGHRLSLLQLLGWMACELAKGLDRYWRPQLVHAHDWHAGLSCAIWPPTATRRVRCSPCTT
ncbi:EamA family transporter, partial [Serratia ureilytica]|nr:EamA family transporter [Serratia ureilytica]